MLAASFSNDVEFKIEDPEGGWIKPDDFRGDVMRWIPGGVGDVADNPLDELDNAIRSMNLVLDQASNFQTDPDVVIRMSFVHAFGAFEAFLSDVLYTRIRDDASALKRFCLNDAEISKEKYTIGQVASDENLLLTRARARFERTSFHDPLEAERLYKAAGFEPIFPDDHCKEALIAAVALRHDCVHRNGRDKDGKPLTSLSAVYVREIAYEMQRIGMSVLRAIAAV